MCPCEAIGFVLTRRVPHNMIEGERRSSINILRGAISRWHDFFKKGFKKKKKIIEILSAENVFPLVKTFQSFISA